jgi:hypothetical protein
MAAGNSWYEQAPVLLDWSMLLLCPGSTVEAKQKALKNPSEKRQ